MTRYRKEVYIRSRGWRHVMETDNEEHRWRWSRQNDRTTVPTEGYYTEGYIPWGFWQNKEAEKTLSDKSKPFMNFISINVQLRARSSEAEAQTSSEEYYFQIKTQMLSKMASKETQSTMVISGSPTVHILNGYKDIVIWQLTIDMIYFFKSNHVYIQPCLFIYLIVLFTFLKNNLNSNSVWVLFLMLYFLEGTLMCFLLLGRLTIEHGICALWFQK